MLTRKTSINIECRNYIVNSPNSHESVASITGPTASLPSVASLSNDSNVLNVESSSSQSFSPPIITATTLFTAYYLQHMNQRAQLNNNCIGALFVVKYIKYCVLVFQFLFYDFE